MGICALIVMIERPWRNLRERSLSDDNFSILLGVSVFGVGSRSALSSVWSFFLSLTQEQRLQGFVMVLLLSVLLAVELKVLT
ncbi:hypothetical protein [Vibrio parahaemolyticus]|uniref:hypothetical protein n=1 Tax=Vibrio parahaemolyticus TaxID=670 RepID=UPI003891E704